MTAETAKEITYHRNQLRAEARRLRTITYVEEVIYNDINYVADLGKRSLRHFLPDIKLDKKLLVGMLTDDNFKVKRFGKLLIIYW